MSNIDKQALRNLALRATPGPWTMEHENIWYCESGYTKHLAYFCQGDDVDDSQDDANTRYVAAADPSTVLALLDELEAAEERYVDMLRQARSFREAHDSASEIIRKVERNKPTVKLPTTRLWAGKIACYEESEVVAMLEIAGINIAAAGKGEAS